MPRVAIRIPAHVLSELNDRAGDVETRDGMWAEAVSDYVKRKGSVATTKTPNYHDRMRREAFDSARMPKTVVDVPDDLFTRADKLAKRLHKSRELLYSEAMAEFLQGNAPPEPDFGHH